MTSTYFVRHTERREFGASLRDEFFKERRFGIHFDNIRSVNPTEYTSAQGRLAIRRLNGIAASGGFVCASLWGKSGCLVGQVEPGSSVEVVVGSTESHQSTVFFKTLRMDKVRHLTGSDARRLLLLAPQGTLRRWNAIKDRVEQWVRFGKVTIREVGDLIPFEQEVMCSEFLRLGHSKLSELPRLVCMSARVGGTQEAVDISGIDERNNSLLAQVTYHPKHHVAVRHKVAALREAGTGHVNRLVFFCRTEEVSTEDEVLYVPLSLVFQAMAKHQPWRKSVGMS